MKMDEGESTSKVEDTYDFRCVQCGFDLKALYIQYSPGNIRLVKCHNCGAVGDEYIECEIMILMIDLILHKPKAYRHLFYNRFSRMTINFPSLLWKLISAFLILDIYRIWALSTKEKEHYAPVGVSSLILDFGKISCAVIIGNLIFLFVTVHGVRKFLGGSPELYRWKEIMLVVLVSSYFKIFLMAMMVWDFPSSAILIIDMFVMSSNIVALKVGLHEQYAMCTWTPFWEDKVYAGEKNFDLEFSINEMFHGLHCGTCCKVHFLSAIHHPKLVHDNCFVIREHF